MRFQIWKSLAKNFTCARLRFKTMFVLEDVVVDMQNYQNLSESSLYSSIHERQARKVLLDNYQPNSSLWLQKFSDTINIAQNKNRRMGLTSIFHGLRILIQRQTIKAIQNQSYQTADPNAQTIIINQQQIINSAKNSKYYKSNDTNNNNNNDNNQTDLKNDDINTNKTKCDIDVVNTDCLDAAYTLLSNNYNPCVLNMANQYTPGGGFQSGAGAQEENLCRRSTLITALLNYTTNPSNKLDPSRKWSYPIETYGVIYNPNVLVFRSNESMGYEFLVEPYSISIITGAMFKRPNYNNKWEYTDKYKPQIVRKLKSILRIALLNNHDSIVLSAWGCGAFKNPPLGQSKLWKNLLLNDIEFAGKFKKVVFAIFDDHNTGKDHNPFGNYLPFVDTFDITKIKLKQFFDDCLHYNKDNNDIDMNNDNDNNDDNDNDIDMKNDNNNVVFGELCQILSNAAKNNAPNNHRDLDYNVIHSKLKNMNSAMSVLYCGGFKRSSDGSKLILEANRAKIANAVYDLLKTYTN